MRSTPAGTDRRRFLRDASAVAVGIAALPSIAAGAAEGSSLTSSMNNAAQDHDRWLANLKAPHRQLFDMPEHADGLPMVHILNYLNTYNTAYNAKDTDINVVGTFYGMTTLFAANDAMWAKYKLGEMLDVKSPNGSPATSNPWRTNVHALGMDIPVASIEALQKRGVLFLVCNNALNFFVGQIAGATKQDVAAVNAEVRQNLLPGTVVVPAMVIAIEKAQKAGFAYNKQ